MREENPVKGFSIFKEGKYKKDCRKYLHLGKRILETELKIISYPEKSRLLHGPLSACKGFLHASVDQNLRILYQPDYKNRIIFLTDLLTHRDMEKKCG